MRVALMAECIQERMSGQAWFTYHLARNLTKIKSIELILIGNNYLEKLDIDAEKLVFRKKYFLPQKLLSVDVLRRINSKGIDVIHSPVNYGLPYFYFTNAKKVKTIHDATGFEIKVGYPLFHKIQLKFQFTIFGDRIDRVVTVSRSSKKEIIKHFKFESSKVDIVYNGVDDIFRPIDKEVCREVLQRYGIKGKYILHISNGSIVKNLDGIIRAFDKVRSRVNCKLVIVGNIKRKVECKDTIYVGYIPYEYLPYFYSGAEIFIFPSFHEGFGLPIVEAMACGTPVITSNVYATKEVAGDAALLVNPYNVDEIAEAIYKILTDEVCREELIRKGIKRAKFFSWEKCARGYADIYREVCNLEH